jgi:exodeoxyribonuclease V beta subunit
LQIVAGALTPPRLDFPMFLQLKQLTESSLMETRNFDPVKTELLKGVNLIEASAGTGKTYAIAMLVLRFVVEQDIAIDKVLVVTFTKMATEELKDRVRSRLAEVKRVLAGYTDNVDSNVIEWLANLNIEP